ncbi:MAG: DEAD/DEAH box helicase [Corynebacterium sp.]|nr:DEAD/DEAH box helicase [Corynebacterium sp.]
MCDALADIGITHTFSIQELTLPIALSGSDLIGQARTGMGKTYGFGVPVLDRVFDDAAIPELDGTPRALIIVPTRELAVQVTSDLQAASAYLPLRITTICGGRDAEKQQQALIDGTDVVVGTPGRLLDLFHNGHLDLSRIAILVMDEADEMLDLGFLPDIEKVFRALEDTPHQTMLFSATMPGPILTLARSFLHKPVHIRAESDSQKQTHTAIKQIVFQAHQMNKLSVLARALQAKGRGRSIIFTRTKRAAAQVSNDLAQLGFAVTAVHGDLNQKDREQALELFRSGSVEILVATDVAARGIDVDDVTHVFNHQVPDDPMTYVHRIGRTGRAGNSGVAVTLVGYDEVTKWQAVTDELDLDIPEPPQWFSTSPEFLAALDIPEDTVDSVGAPRKVIGVRATSPSVDTQRNRKPSRRKRK